MLCQKFGLDMPYQKCLTLLPPGQQGSSMLELKRTIQSLGFSVEARKLGLDESTRISTPAVVLLLPPRRTTRARSATQVGHYMLLWPLDAIRFEVLDYPRPPFIVSKEYWAEHLKSVGIEHVPALLCRKPPSI